MEFICPLWKYINHFWNILRSSVQQIDSVLHLYILFHILFHYSSLQDIDKVLPPRDKLPIHESWLRNACPVSKHTVSYLRLTMKLSEWAFGGAEGSTGWGRVSGRTRGTSCPYNLPVLFIVVSVNSRLLPYPSRQPLHSPLETVSLSSRSVSLFLLCK